MVTPLFPVVGNQRGADVMMSLIVFGVPTSWQHKSTDIKILSFLPKQKSQLSQITTS